jgi:hypothetical protein
MVRSIVGCLVPAIVISACSMGLPDNLDDYMRAHGRLAGTVTSTDGGQQPFTGGLSCTPQLEADGGATVTSTWRPPPPIHRGACTSAQADQLVHCIYTDPFHTTKACQDFLAAPENQACSSCGYTPYSDPVWGPIVSGQFAGVPIENIEGCVAAVSGDNSTTGCGAKMLALQDCEAFVCRNCAEAKDFNACADTADTTMCASFASGAACAKPFMDQCLPTTIRGPIDAGRNLVKVFCER